ncbi:DEAD/DEAH box helicase [Nonomuraea turkmeniaca]|uniref:DEAD/DEAH box helicase n=1 Tax=Nonomuraea turkmeniaca TaxID=103838 RepID=A0A5S4FQD2_9ACTN|nr:DEAD/DEAH box helicase family protein [Nonomuraea turkmeniaca]TMR22634.1 DEAD/DEAH box helicase [Nonomuraea turkmeniaca]
MVSTLRHCGVGDHYRSDTDDIVADFFEPCLGVASRYDRAVGYFTSTSLALVARGVGRLAENKGRIRLIASPHLTEEDIEQIELGYEYRQVIERALLREIGSDVEKSPALLNKLGLLGKLVGQGILDIRIALVRRGDRLALYHEKIGIFTDKTGHQVAFSGSSNETGRAFIDNFESIEVFRSWEPSDASRAQRLAKNFTQLWDGDTPHLEVFDFPVLGKERMLELATSAKAMDDESPRHTDTGILIGTSAGAFQIPRVPPNLKLRDYQRQAIRAWFEANGRGIFQMATGTGKTITALAAITKLAEVYDKQDRPLLAIVIAPQLHLVDQWAREARSFGIRPLCCYDDAKTWIDSAHALTSGLAARTNGFAMMISTNATLARPAFQQMMQQYQSPFVLIADEAHNLGAASSLAALPSNTRHRLALSATPERWFDPIGTDALRNYFGDTLINLGLRDAIKIGALCEYDYRPIPVQLDSDESQQYALLSQRIARLMGEGDSDPDLRGNDELSMLLLKRAQLLSHARGKLPALAVEAKARRHLDWQLVYCAEGSAPQEAEQGSRQLDQVSRLLGRDLGIPSHPYTSAESRSERQRILERFRSTDLKALISMRCLDEGVDVPDARVAYMLASSSNPRQFIQRRGRILRRTEGKEVAEIVDFIAVPSGEIDVKLERRLLRREIARFTEFASCARNAGEALAIMRPLRVTYGLMDV